MRPAAAILRRLALPLAAIVCLVPSCLLLRNSTSGSILQGLGFGILGLGLLIAGAIGLAVMFSRRVGEGVGSALYLPSQENERPPPVYGFAETRRARGEYEAAMALLDGIANEHPQELRTYVLMIDIAVTNLRDAARAGEAFRRGLAAVRGEDDRTALENIYEAVRTRLDTPPPPGTIPLAKDGAGHVHRALPPA